MAQRSSDRVAEQIGNAFLEHLVGGQAERIQHAVPSVLAGTVIVENIPGNLGQSKGIVKLSIREQTTVRGDLGAVKFQLQTAVETDPQRGLLAFTRRVTRGTFVLRCV
jgi:hypothetical protein